jgi:hypothetical protein
MAEIKATTTLQELAVIISEALEAAGIIATCREEERYPSTATINT